MIALSVVCYIMFEIEFLRRFDPGKVMENMGKVRGKYGKSHGIQEQNPCMNSTVVTPLSSNAFTQLTYQGYGNQFSPSIGQLINIYVHN